MASHPLTVQQAKARVRATARHLGLESWARQHPREFLLLGLAAGFLSGRHPDTRNAIIQLLLRHFR